MTSTPCHGIAGAYQPAQVNIGWWPYLAAGPAQVTSKPGGGTLLATIPAGGGFAVQSIRNPSCSPFPPVRPAIRGVDGRDYLWGYKRNGAKTGLVLASLLTPDPRPWRGNELTGPAGLDFQPGRSTPQPAGRNGCGKRSLTAPLRQVAARELHFRYAPHSTSYHYLHRGDTVRVLIVQGPQGQCFVEVLDACPDGSARPLMRGWVTASALSPLPKAAR